MHCGLFGFYYGCRIGAATSVAAMQVKIGLYIKWLLLLRLGRQFGVSLFRFRYSRAGPKEPNGGELFYESAGSWEI